MNKKLIFILLATLQSFCISAATIDILGVRKQIDTLEYRMIGPGVSYTRFNLPDYPLSAYMLTIDMTNPYNFVETFQAADQLGKTEAMTSAYNRLNADSHTTLAGVNGNFWIVSGQGQPTELLGVPHSGSARNGEILTDPNNWNRGHGSIGFAMIDSDKKVWIDDISFAGKVKLSGGEEYPVSQINRIRGENELVVFNNYLGAGKTTRTDNNGTEVFVRPVEGYQWGTNEDVKCVVTRVIANQGANLPETGEYVLSGNGTAQTFLSGLSPEDIVTVNLSVQTLTDNLYPKVKQMITGNALVMKDGVLTNRNYNEAYNSQLYPRTGIGSSPDGKTLFLIVIDKKGTSVGANTETMCGILKAVGADKVTTMDGGGSAQMMIGGNIVNNPADGKERAVANGWFLYHNAPADNQVTQIAFNDLRNQLPSLALYKPVVLGYNQYGVLIDQDVKGYTLSCSDGLGEITAEGDFIANGNSTNGTLTVTYNGVSVSKKMNIVSADISFKLDSVLIDNNDYSVKVQSISDNEVLNVPSTLLTWTVKDNTICTIENGVINGLKNGRTMVYGSVGAAKDSLIVQVEIPDYPDITHDDFTQENNTWSLSASSQLSASLSATNLPAAWTSGLAVNFTYKAGRAPFIKLSNQKPLYSLPDSIKIVLNTGGVLIDRALISLRPNNNKQTVPQEYSAFPTEKSDLAITYALSDFFDTTDRAIFPVWFDNMNFYLHAQTENQSYTIALKEIRLIYNNSPVSGIKSPTGNTDFQVYPNPVQGSEIMVRFNKPADKVDFELFNLSGQKIMSRQSVIVNANTISIPAGDLAPGYYLLTITQDQQKRTLKIIKK